MRLRRHHNNKGYGFIKKDIARERLREIAHKFNIPFEGEEDASNSLFQQKVENRNRSVYV